jgi:hypothetical protein
MLNRPRLCQAAALLSRPSTLLQRIVGPAAVVRIRRKSRGDKTSCHGMMLGLAGTQ